MARAAAEHAPRYAWPHVAAEVLGAYEDAIDARRAPRPTAASRASP